MYLVVECLRQTAHLTGQYSTEILLKSIQTCSEDLIGSRMKR